LLNAIGHQEGHTQGELLAARHAVIQMATERFGELPQELESDINAIADIDKLENLQIAVLKAESAHDLLRS